MLYIYIIIVKFDLFIHLLQHMKIFTGITVISALFLTIFTLSAKETDSPWKDTVSISDFGAVPDDGKDDTGALRKAAAYCRSHPGCTLLMPEGVYILRDRDAERLEAEVMSGKMGQNPEETIFTPYYPYVKGMDFSGSESVTVEAEGATIMCGGWMEPVSVTESRNFTLKGLTIDYIRKPFSEGTVIEVNPDNIVVRFRDGDRLDGNTPFPRIMIWDSMKNGVFGEVFYFPEHQMLGDATVRFSVSVPNCLKGEKIAAPHSFHFRPAIYIGRSSGVLLQDVTIHSQPGMGITGFDSSDITMKGLNVTPSDGYSFSTNTDATHFACCRGRIVFDGCAFKAQGDDATNVHGYYHDIASVSDDGVITLELRSPTFTHSQTADIPRPGDIVEVSPVSTVVPAFTATVTDVFHQEKSTSVQIRIDRELPVNFRDYCIFNTSALPELEFRNSIVWGNLARGVLVKTRGVLIEKNVFIGCSGTAVHIGAESGWKEGAHTIDATVCDNVMVNCGSGPGTKFGASGIAVVIEAPETSGTILHDGIRIYGNTVIGWTGRQDDNLNGCGIAVRNARNVKIHDNHIENCVESISTCCTENISIK